jgi:phosphatidylglycerol:prolipoprotein diacylglycerol transferase
MKIPFEPIIFGYSLNTHLIIETLAFFVAFRYYVYLKKNTSDRISKNNRLSILLGAIIGAFLGSRLIGFLENPIFLTSLKQIVQLYNCKTIMGGLFGGLLGVEIAKKIIKEPNSSGDLFTFPLIFGIFIGRIGCFLSGINEFTYGEETTFFTGMYLGDGLLRHPISLYELFFLIILYLLLKKVKYNHFWKNGDIFKLFMIGYFSFRLIIEFLKPNIFFTLGLSSIQWLCIVCLMYYFKTFKTLFYRAH